MSRHSFTSSASSASASSSSSSSSPDQRGGDDEAERRVITYGRRAECRMPCRAECRAECRAVPEPDPGARRVLARPSWARAPDCLMLQIRQKLAGYAYQDRRKNRPPGELDADQVLALLEACAFRCMYCHVTMPRVWRTPRDPAQWTLDRVDNDGPHSRANVVPACMACNLRRRARSHARFREGADLVRSMRRKRTRGTRDFVVLKR